MHSGEFRLNDQNFLQAAVNPATLQRRLQFQLILW